MTSSLSVGKSQNYQKLRINYVTATSCVSCVPGLMFNGYLRARVGFGFVAKPKLYAEASLLS